MRYINKLLKRISKRIKISMLIAALSGSVEVHAKRLEELKKSFN